MGTFLVHIVERLDGKYLPDLRKCYETKSLQCTVDLAHKVAGERPKELKEWKHVAHTNLVLNTMRDADIPDLQTMHSALLILTMHSLYEQQEIKRLQNDTFSGKVALKEAVESEDPQGILQELKKCHEGFPERAEECAFLLQLCYTLPRLEFTCGGLMSGKIVFLPDPQEFLGPALKYRQDNLPPLTYRHELPFQV